ncbi:MAG: hypothetical protein EA357_06250 [Micavibrio sp.]|nr:MAG: hypothetical protein EA357_06250 [Micavibrio sp.]
MQIFKILFLALGFVLLTIQALYAETINLGNRTIEFPAPLGYTNILPLSDEVKGYVGHLVLEGNIILAYYIPSNKAGKFLMGEIKAEDVFATEQHFMVQADRQFIDAPLQEGSFLRFKEVVRTQYKDILNQIKSDAGELASSGFQEIINDVSSKHTNIELDTSSVKMDIPNVIPLDDIFETDKSIQIGYIVKYELSLDIPDYEMVDTHFVQIIQTSI